MISFADWMKCATYLTEGIEKGTTEEALLLFFHRGISPWMKNLGYNWSSDDDVIARKFLRFCYDMHTTLKMNPKFTLAIPEPKHRNYDEDRITFDYFVDTRSLVDLFDDWHFRSEIVGTRLDYLLREFCYVWVNVEAGKPGAFTQAALAADEDDGSDEDRTQLPDGNWSRRQHDLY